MTHQRIYLQLGALGDIVNLLPLLWHDAQSGQLSALMVAKKYADVLEGCSYVTPIIFDGEPHEIERAYLEARQISGDVRCCQVNGPEDQVRRFSFEPSGAPHAVQDSFSKESWRLAGHINLWSQNLPLVFDQRDAHREQRLLKQLEVKDSVAPVVIAVDGQSSPFGYKQLLLELIRGRVKKRKIVDIGQVRAERFYDLLALYETAHFIVASDSAPLHLAQAALKTPVIALVNDRPTYWHGSPWRPNHLFHCRYSDFPRRAVEMLEAIEGLLHRGSYFCANHAVRNIVHVWSEYEGAALTEAVKSWQREYPYNWIRCPIEPGVFGRDSRIILKDPKRLPYLRDVIRAALMRAKDGDIICLTRNDSLFPVGLSEALKDVSDDKPFYGHRIDRNYWHPTPDLFAFTPAWWKAHRNDVPDMIMGRDYHWPRVLLELFKAHGGTELRCGVQKIETPVTEVKGAPPRIFHNETLAKGWLASHNVTSLFPDVTKQKEPWPLNRRGLSPFGYNGSLIQWQNRLLMAYRWHRDGNDSTVLAMAEIGADGNVKNNLRVEASGRSTEDPRLFIYRDELWCSYVESNWPEMPAKSIVRYGKLIESNGHWRVDGQWQLPYGQNDGTAMEKNWLFFNKGDDLFCIYANGTVLQIADNKVVKEFNPAACYWPWGNMKGGALVPYGDDAFLRFFHTRLDNEPAPYRSRYYVGAVVMLDHPPFSTIGMTKEPLLRGSEDDALTVTERATCAHRKPKVVFPMGVVKADDACLLSVGINDAACAVVKIRERDLNL